MKTPNTATGIVDSMGELIGQTPMVRLRRLVTPNDAEVVVKLESFNPGGSVKDRIAWSMVETAEKAGLLKPGDTIVEPTSGNTGIGLAVVSAIKGYRLIITMPDDASFERIRLLEHFGAQVVLTPAKKLMKGAIQRAQRIVKDNPNCFMPEQFRNPANPDTHRRTTAQEILAATDNHLDAFVCGVGTGGTISGVGSTLKAHLEDIQVIAVEPDSSRALTRGPTKPHGIQGIGAGFIPDTCDEKVIDRILHCHAESAYQTARQLARLEGISAGLSAGANVWAALQVAAELGPGKRVLTLICDSWDRYVSQDRSLGPIPGLDFII